MTTEGPQLPHIEVFHRVLGLPMVGMAVSKSAATYSRVKGSHQFVHLALTRAETSLSSAIKQAVPIAAPIAKKLESPIQFVDHTLCLGLDKIEQKVPLVTKEPEQIVENAVSVAMSTVRSTVFSIVHIHEMILAEAESLRNRSWDKANQILGTHYGSVAVKGIDSTAGVVDKLIDKYFPATGEEETIVITSEKEDKLLHTLQTVGRLSNKAARRVYSNVIHHLRTLNKDNLKSYVSSLVQFLHLTQYLQAVNEQVQNRTRTAKDDSTSSTSSTNSAREKAD